MKVHLIKKQTLEDYIHANAQGKVSFEIWLSKIKWANWEKPEDIKNTIGSADLLGNGSSRVVFNIGGNKYRLICKYMFGRKRVHLFVCWIGTHAEYSKLCDAEGQYLVKVY